MLGKGCLYFAAAIITAANATVYIGYINGIYVIKASLQIAFDKVQREFD